MKKLLMLILLLNIALLSGCSKEDGYSELSAQIYDINYRVRDIQDRVMNITGTKYDLVDTINLEINLDKRCLEICDDLKIGDKLFYVWGVQRDNYDNIGTKECIGNNCYRYTKEIVGTFIVEGDYDGCTDGKKHNCYVSINDMGADRRYYTRFDMDFRARKYVSANKFPDFIGVPQ